MSKEFIEKRKAEHKAAYGNYIVGPFHIHNKPPTSKEEAQQHGNALAASGNYPVGTSECFNVGISGGCGTECYIYREGRCSEPQEMITRLESEEDRAFHAEAYPQDTEEIKRQEKP